MEWSALYRPLLFCLLFGVVVIKCSILSDKTWLTYYINLAVFLLGAIALVVSSGYSLGPAMLLLASPVLLFRRTGPVLGRQGWAIIASLFFYVVVSFAEVIWDGQSTSGFDKPSRYLLAIPVLLLLLVYPPKAGFMWAGLAIGAIASGSWALWQKLIDDEFRAGGYTHIIQFGNLNMLLGILCLAGLGWAWVQTRSRFWLVLLLAGAGMGIVGSLMSGSRGGWVGFPFVLLVLYRAYGRHLSRPLLIGIITLIILGGTVIYIVPQFGVQLRVNQTFNEIHSSIEQHNPTSSLGARFEMWRAAGELIPQKPIVGWGSIGYEQARDQLIEKGEIHPYISNFEHVHNEYLDAWLKRGMIGLLALLALYLVPMRLFILRMHSHDLHLRAIAVAGVLLPVAYMDFGISQVFLAHNSGVMMYSFLLVVLWACMKNRERQLQYSK